MSNDEHIRLVLDLIESGGVATSTKHLEDLGVAAKKVKNAADEAAHSSQQMNMRILNLGRAAQDLAQGGFAGILNNIEGIIGGGGLAAGVLTALGTAAFIATPFIKEWVKGLGSAGETFKPLVEGLEKYSEAIKNNKEKIKDLKEQGDLTYDQLMKYKDLVAETTKLEEEQANAREARSVKVGSSARDRANAEAVRNTISERYGSSQELLDTIMTSDTGQQLGQKRIEEVIAGALKGFGHDIQSLRNISPQFNERYQPFSPEAKQQFDQAKQMFKREQAFQASKERDAAKQRQETERAESDAKRAVEQLDQTQAREQVEARRLGNQIKEKGEQQRNKTQNIDTEKLKPLQDPNQATNQIELNQILQENQAITLHNEMIISRQMFQSRQIQQQLRNVPNAMVGQQ